MEAILERAPAQPIAAPCPSRPDSVARFDYGGDVADQRAQHNKGITPPKGRPTRGRDEILAQRRVFGPTAQWITLTFVIVLVIVAVIVLLDGGDFNVFNNGTSG